MSSNSYRFETSLVHAGEPENRIERASQTPIFQTSVYEHKEGADYHDIWYPRLNNLPNQTLLAKKIAALEGGEDGLVLASGMAAISSSLFSILRPGGHLLAQSCLYGGTHNLLTNDFDSFGLSYDFIDGKDISSWKQKLQKTTRAIYSESISNPLCEVAKHEALVQFAKENDLISIIDNTFATPVNFQPLKIGYDLVVHSATKYLNGHSDLVAGVVVGSRALIEKIRHLANHMGGCLEPFACFLLTRGIKTLSLRVRQQNENALKISEYLSSRPNVRKVNYPGLLTHPDHQYSKELFQGFGGMLSFEIEGGKNAAKQFVNQVKLALHAPSLGGPETLVTLPATTSHRGMTSEERNSLGISDGLIRVSIGIEHPEDIIEDFTQAMEN